MPAVGLDLRSVERAMCHLRGDDAGVPDANRAGGVCDLQGGFYRSGTECVACTAHCTTCTNTGCSICDDAFWLEETSLKCRPSSELTHCAAVTGR